MTDSMHDVAVAAELLGISAEQAAAALRALGDEFHPEKLMHEISKSFSVDERAELQLRVRTAMIEQPEISIVEHMLDAAVAIEAERE